MENSSSSNRLQRLLVAMEIKPPEFDAAVAVKLDAMATKQQESQQTKTPSADRRAAIEIKMKMIENWEATKLKATERLAVEMEALQEIEEAIEKREQELANSGIKVDTASRKRRRPSNQNNNNDKNEKNHMPGNGKQNTRARSKSAGARKAMPKEIAARMENDEEDIVIGPNGTRVSKAALNAINWSLSATVVMRKILMEVFDRKTLASHTLSGRPSPAFIDCNKPLKQQLDPLKVADLMHIGIENLNMTTKEVRSAIITKCADENKMLRLREQKKN